MTCLAVQFATFPGMGVGVGCVEDGTMGRAIFIENVGEGSGKGRPRVCRQDGVKRLKSPREDASKKERMPHRPNAAEKYFHQDMDV